jgi:putative oxygen-independent coproporphyrinogen III oxidase
MGRTAAPGQRGAPAERLAFVMLPRHLYVHVPFCARRCSYCDFSIAVRDVVPVDEYVDAVGAELALRFAGNEPWELDTLYFGGGTPSRLGAAGVARLLATICRRVTLVPDAEVTLEVNPEDATAQAAAAWRSAGVNRVSLGTQSFDDRALAWMRRTHDGARAEHAVEVVRAAGIDNVSLDLIFALPTVLERSWESDLERALGLAPSHVSLYGLTVEQATPLGRWVERGEVAEPPEERYEEEFLRAHDAMTAAGFEHYEVSNFARPGRRSRHNWAYWSGAAYAGIGPAAHGFDGGHRRWNVAPYEQWRRRLATGLDPVGGTEALTAENRVTEAVYLGLRTAAGLRLSGGEVGSVRPWIQAGWATVEDGARLVLRAPGWLRLDALTQSLTAARSL